MTDQASPNPNPNPNPNPQFSPSSVPAKRRRGRPARRSLPIPFQSQVFPPPPPPPQSNELALSNNIENNSNSNSNSKINDISEEIIVINKNATSEALIALSAGFPADSFTEEEIDAGVVSVIGGIEQINYILIRNHILTKWREHVSNWLLKEDFVNLIPSHCGTLLDSAYNYLVSHGYVNFGVAPGIKEKILVEASKPNVIVIGAGLAGLAAARQLMGFGFKVVVLEGRKRAGGRVYTKKMEAGCKTAAADLGGSVLTGILGNPLGILARQLSYSLHKVRDKCPIYRVDGNPVDPDTDLKVEAAFNKLLDKASQLRQLMGEVSVDISLGAALETFQEMYGDEVNSEEMKLFNWHFANLEYANAGLISKLSLAFWDQDDPYDMGGDHCFLPGGNGRLVQALAENVPIIYEKTVHSIRYGSDGVQVVTGSQIFEGDMALCTVPLGVLKSGSIKFNPELPQRKLDGIKRLGFGLLNKVAMLFPHVFWSMELDTFGHLTDDPSHRGEFFLFYSYATVAGGPLLLALVAGEAAHNFETMPATDAVARVLQILKGIFEPQGIEVPEPIQTVCTRWGTDPFSLGSYSNVAVGASGDDYDILAESVGDGRLFFAGEATTRRYPASMHGAFLTGLREAANMVHHANARALKINVEKGPSKNAQSSATLLADLFREPDLDFGSFSAIFAQRNSDPKSTAILRVTFNGSRKKSNDESKQDQQHSNKLLFQQLQSHFNQQQQIHVYTLLSRQQVHELMEVRGGDEMRMHYLSEKLGVKLVGRRGLGSSADSVIAAIKSERGDRRSTSTSLARKTGILKRRASNAKSGLVRRAKVVRRGNDSVPSPNEVGTGKEETAKVVRRSKIPVIRRVETGTHREENSKAVWRGNESESTPPVETGTGIEERAELVSSGIESTSPSVETGTGIVESALVAWTSNPSTGTNIEERDELVRRGNKSAPSPAETGSVIEEYAIVVSRSNESMPPLEIGTCIKETENLLWRGNESEPSLVNTGTGREEPSSDGRCKRNGKRWRCSREVFPGKIYCEKHFMDAEVRNQKRRKRIKALILVEAPFDGKCKRNGKRWRCSKDVIPGKIYCEKHLMQAEIRNRKRRKVVREQEQKFLVAQQNEVGNTDLITFTPMEDNCGVSHENQIMQNEAITGNLGLQDSLAVVECSNNLSSQSLPTSLSQLPVPSLFEDHDGETSQLSIGADTNVATSDDHHVSKGPVSGVDPEGILMVSPLIKHPGIASEECDGSRIFKEPRDTKYLEEFFQNVASDGDEGEDDSSQGDVSTAETFNLD